MVMVSERAVRGSNLLSTEHLDWASDHTGRQVLNISKRRADCRTPSQQPVRSPQ